MTDKPYSKYAILNEILKPAAPVVAPKVIDDEDSEKSSAQVETLVAPPVVLPKSGGLKPRKKERSHPLAVRFNDNELEAVKDKARKAGCTVNSYIRQAALGSDYKPPVDPELHATLLALNLELTRQGNNLNQIARHLNAALLSPSHGESQLAVLARSMLKTHLYIRQALNREPAP